jgi:uncharacterized protein (DUF305 family)
MPDQASRYLLFALFALVSMIIGSIFLSSGTTSTVHASTVVSEVICKGATPSPVASPEATPSPVASPVAIEFDQIYLDLMIAQQQRLLTIALIAKDRSQSPEVEQLSQQIIDGTEPVVERLKDTRAAWFDQQPVLGEAAIMRALDDIGRAQPAVGGVPGAVEIVQGEGVVAELCSEFHDFDVHFLTELIDQLDHGILFSEAAKQLAGRDETKVIAALVIDTDQPFKDNAIAYRDLLLQGSPIPDDH